MGYATVTDLITRLGDKAVIELTNPHQRATAVDEGVANAAIADGQALVDSYIGQRVSLPLDDVPHFVKTLTVDLAIYYLKTKVGNTATKESTTAKLYDDAIKHLGRFATGETSLGLAIDDTTTTDDDNGNTAEITSQPRQNTRVSLGRLT